MSLPSLNSQRSNTFPLSSLADECARHFGIDPCDQLVDEAGNYFALARIFPSSKVGKDNHVIVLLRILLFTAISHMVISAKSDQVLYNEMFSLDIDSQYM